jgi:hypothetical protein
LTNAHGADHRHLRRQRVQADRSGYLAGGRTSAWAADLTTEERDERLRQQLLGQGATLERADEILAQFHLAWDLFASLTLEEEEALEEAKIDQINFFKRPLTP